MKYIVDRIENGFAVCENEELVITNISISSLPYGTKEGSVIICEDGRYVLQNEEEAERRSRILSLQDELFSS